MTASSVHGVADGDGDGDGGCASNGRSLITNTSTWLARCLLK